LQMYAFSRGSQAGRGRLLTPMLITAIPSRYCRNKANLSRTKSEHAVAERCISPRLSGHCHCGEPDEGTRDGCDVVEAPADQRSAFLRRLDRGIDLEIINARPMHGFLPKPHRLGHRLLGGADQIVADAAWLLFAPARHDRHDRAADADEE